MFFLWSAECHDHCDLQTQSFHSTMLPNLQVSVYCSLTAFENEISPWMDPSQWLKANMKHIHSIFDGIVALSKNANINAMSFPVTMIFPVCQLTFRFLKLVVSLIIHQRLMLYIFAYNILCSGDKPYFFFFLFFLALFNVIISLLDKVNAMLKKYRDWDILNLMRNQRNIKNELSSLFRNGSHVCIHTPFCYLWSYWCFQEHREMQFEDLLKKLLVLDSIALSANIEVLVADGDTCEEIVETQGVGAQSLVNLLHTVCLQVFVLLLVF